MSNRYRVDDETHTRSSRPWAVLDTQGPTEWLEYVCECRTEEHAKMVCDALNAQEAARKRRNGVSAVVYQASKQNAPHAKEEAKAKGLAT